MRGRGLGGYRGITEFLFPVSGMVRDVLGRVRPGTVGRGRKRRYFKCESYNGSTSPTDPVWHDPNGCTETHIVVETGLTERV